MDYSKELFKLVNEMGFSRVEAEMALKESQGKLDVAIEKLTSGAYAPPPYDAQYTQKNQPSTSSGYYPKIEEKNRIDDPTKFTVSKMLSDLKGKHNVPLVEDKPTAPSFSALSKDLNQIRIELPDGAKEMPPPYEVNDKTQKFKSWEQQSNVFHFDYQNTSSSTTAQQNQPIYLRQGDRCDVCFNILESSENVLSQNKKVLYTLYFLNQYFSTFL